MPQIVEIIEAADLAPYQLAWRSLWYDTPRGTFFQSFEWLQMFSRHFAASGTLRVLVAASRGDIIGILPLVDEAGRRRLRYAVPQGLPFGGPIGPHPTATLNVAMRYLAGQRNDWDLLELAYTDDRGRTHLAMQLAQLSPQLSRTAPVTSADLTHGCTGLLANRSFGWRQRALERQVIPAGHLQLERYRPRGSMWGDDDLLQSVMAETCQQPAWQWQGLWHAAPHPSQPHFGEFHATAVAAGACDLVVLRLNEQAIAAAYNVQHNGRLICLSTGFDREHAGLFPDELLLERMLQDSCRRSDRVVYLGNSQWDRGWLSSARETYHCRSFSKSARGQWLRMTAAFQG